MGVPSLSPPPSYYPYNKKSNFPERWLGEILWSKPTTIQKSYLINQSPSEKEEASEIIYICKRPLFKKIANLHALHSDVPRKISNLIQKVEEKK